MENKANIHLLFSLDVFGLCTMLSDSVKPVWYNVINE